MKLVHDFDILLENEAEKLLLSIPESSFNLLVWFFVDGVNDDNLDLGDSNLNLWVKLLKFLLKI